MFSPSLPPPNFSKRFKPRTAGYFFGGGLQNVSRGEIKMLILLVFLSTWVRWWRLDRPSSVVFDEVHFGGFATKYIKAKFFMDVHPPLAKLLITLAGWLAGFTGNFDFKEIGKDYAPDHVPYIAMRLMTSTLGILVIPLTYLTLRLLNLRPLSSAIGALFVLFDNALITQSRLILLDSPLVFFTALTTFAWCGFSNECSATPIHRPDAPIASVEGENSVITEKLRDPRVSKLATASGERIPVNDRNSFTNRWWIWLVFTGLALGATLSVKWVGLFTTALIGCMTIVQLWNLLGNIDISIFRLTRHFFARAVGLIAVPIVFYMLMFAIHFALLHSSGDGDAFMSSEFKHTLRGHGMADTYADVFLGSKITIKHYNTHGGYLHSHNHAYPAGSGQQQITLYPHRDENNDWHVFNTTTEEEYDAVNADPPVPIKNHQTLRLEHITTNKRLHSHDIRPPVTEVDYQNEVSGYGFDGFSGDANDHWTIEFNEEFTAPTGDKKAMKQLRALRTRFRLKHSLTGCYLFSHKVKLPDWAYEQQEVTCNKNPTLANSIWYVETNDHVHIPKKTEKVNYQLSGFFSKFFELQQVMWKTNAGLTDRHAYDSRPESWPILKRGINFWVKEHRQVYLMGNPFIWWTSSLAVFSYLGFRGLLILRAKRGYQDLNNSVISFYNNILSFTVLGWGLHYFPFFLMQRQLFLHHYLPALWFAILTFSVLFDAVTIYLKPKVRLQIAGVLIIIMLWNWLHFSPIAYAGQWTQKQCNSAKWLKTWDFSCNDFMVNYSDYASVKSIAPTPKKITDVKDPLGLGGNKEKEVEKAEVTVQPEVEPIKNVFEGEPEHPKSEEVRLAGEEKEQAPIEETLRKGSSREDEEDEDEDVDHDLPAQPEPTTVGDHKEQEQEEEEGKVEAPESEEHEDEEVEEEVD